jgi:hypothetical protein
MVLAQGGGQSSIIRINALGQAGFYSIGLAWDKGFNSIEIDWGHSSWGCN